MFSRKERNMYGCVRQNKTDTGSVDDHTLSRTKRVMYASVRRYQTDPGSVDEVLRRVDEGFAPIVITGGFMDYYVLDAGGGVILSISVFEDKAGAEESDRLAVDWVGQNLASLIPGPPEITAGEVRVHKMA
jgi:hypothetical protein